MSGKARKPGTVRIGVSGWTYAPWRGAFYPPELPQRRHLAHAAGIFPALEVNGTFYRLQTPQVFERWRQETPEGFVFAVKGPRFITHTLRLRDPAVALANFFASGVLALGPKLGPLLWQLPPSLRFDPALLSDFLALLPQDTRAAATCAAGHEDWMEGRVLTRTDRRRPLRHALEIRHDSFLDESFLALLRRHQVALVCADTVSWPLRMDLTTDFVYCRLHGSEELYRSRYPAAALDRWAERIEAWSQGEPMQDGRFIGGPDEKPRPRDVFLFFDNTDKLHAPDDAQVLMRRLGQAPDREGAAGRAGQEAARAAG